MRGLVRRIWVAFVTASVGLTFLGALVAVTQRLSGSTMIEIPRLPSDALLSASGVLATLVVAIQFGARFDRSPATANELDDAARGAFLGVIALVCMVGSITIGLLTAFWYGWRDGHIDVTVVLGALSGSALLAFASADAMLLTEHDLDQHVSRIQGRRRWIRARAVVVFERSRPLTGWALARSITYVCLVPVLTTALSEAVLPSTRAIEVAGRFVLMAVGASLAFYAVYLVLTLLLSRQTLSGVVALIAIASVVLLVWDAALFDSSGQAVTSAERMAEQWIAYAFLAASLPLTVFAGDAGARRGRRGLVLEAAYRHFLRQERLLREHDQSPNPTTPRGRVSANAVAAAWTAPLLPICVFFAARAFDELRSMPALRGRRRTVAALITSSTVSAAFLGSLVLVATSVMV